MKLIKVVVLVLFIFSLTEVVCTNAASFSIDGHYPPNKAKVETMKIILQTDIISNNEPIANVWVHFYLDGEWIGVDYTDINGTAYFVIDTKPEFGIHKWKIRAERTGYDTLYSTEWSLNYQPRPKLTLYNKWGETFGEGNYTYGEEIPFGLVSPIVQTSEGVRYVFKEWISNQAIGYNGNQSTSTLVMTDDVNQYAEWRKEYYLDIDTSLPRFHSPRTGWYAEGKLIELRVQSPAGVEFIEWIGDGNGSYTGVDLAHTIKMNSPITQIPVFLRDTLSLVIQSEMGDPFGIGYYPAWENVTFGIDEEYIYLDNRTRYHFTGWESDSFYGYEGDSISQTIELCSNITEIAIWQKQYYVEIFGGDGGYSNVQSLWVNENEIIPLRIVTSDGYVFQGWDGEGVSSYSGKEGNYSIVVRSPLSETPIWLKLCNVDIKSELAATGEGQYLEGDQVTISAEKSEGLIVQKKFKTWSGDVYSSDNPFTFTISRDMYITAVYEKNYYLFIGIIGLLFIALSVFLIRSLRI